MRIGKLYNPDTLKFKIVIHIGWRTIPLTGFWFKDKRINYKKGGEKMKYNCNKGISIVAIYNLEKTKTTCFLSHLSSLITTFVPSYLDAAIPLDKNFIDWMERDQERVNWLMKHNFIELLPSITYSIGDKFTYKQYVLLLASADQNRNVVLIHLDKDYRGLRFREPMQVKSLYKITEEEFKALTSGFVLTKMEEE